jgi:WS/DGAT/MGAT family acyltransferase
MPSFYAYDRLSALDNSFLGFEDPNTHMHVAATAIFEPGPLALPGGGIDIARLDKYVLSRIDRIPRYRQRLDYVPIEGYPVWVDDDRFNLRYHLRQSCLPRPGEQRQLKRLSARILSQQLDRGKPLWEMSVVEGLEDGRFALVSKTHHCMIDGIAGIDILSVLLDPDPNATADEPTPWIARSAPTRLQLLRDEAARMAAAPLTAFGKMLRDPRRVYSDLRESIEAMAETLSIGFEGCSPTPFNRPLGPHRRFDWLTLDLTDVREIKDRLGGSVNDVVLATVSGAVREFLRKRRVNVDYINFRGFVPVSVRAEDEQHKLGNRVAAWITRLPVDEPDPRVRLARVQEATANLKHSKQALGAEVLTRVTGWTPSTVLSLAARISTRVLPFNMVITNVPGPQVPLYLLGSRLVEIYPQVPLFYNQGLGVALFSYAGKLFWGFTADWELFPDLHDMVVAVEDSFAELLALAKAEPTGERRRKRTRRYPSRRSDAARRDERRLRA